MQGHHQGRRPLALRQRRNNSLAGLSQHGKGPVARLVQVPMFGDGNAGFEHGGEVGWLIARETEINVAQALEGGQRVGAAVVPGRSQTLGETLEALAGHIRQQGIPVAEMTVRRRRADASE